MARIHVIESASSNPSAAPDFVGQHWIRVDTKQMWRAKGTSYVSDWVEELPDTGITQLTGDVTAGPGSGSQAATIDKTAITNKTLVTPATGDSILLSDVSDSGNLKRATVSSVVALVTPAGSNTQVQFNDSGAFGADSTFNFNKTTKVLTANEFQVGAAYPVKTLSNNNEIVIGPSAGDSATGDTNEVVFIGSSAGKSSDNVLGALFIGSFAGQGATYDLLGPSIYGSTFIGAGAGTYSVNAYSSLAVGNSALQGATGNNNSAFGGYSCMASSSVTNSLGLGSYVFEFASGTNNVGVGDYAFQGSSNAETNVGLGSYAMSSCPDATFNTAIGSYSMAGTATPFACAAFGYSSLANAFNPYYTVAIGQAAGSSSHELRNSLAIGASSCYNMLASYANNSGNIAIGASSMESSDSIETCVALGAYAGANTTSNIDSIFIGSGAGQYTQTITSSLFIGINAGSQSNTLTGVIAIGDTALGGSTSAPAAIAIGSRSLYGVLNAQSTVAIGNGSGGSEFGGGYVNLSTFVGDQSGYQAYTASNSIFIGDNSGLNDTVNNYIEYGWNILLGSNTNTGGFPNSIAIGGWIANSASAQCNIGNAFYIDGIYTTATQSATPVTTAKHGFCTDTPQATIDVEGDIKLGVGGAVFQSVLSATDTLDFPSTGPNDYSDLTMTVTGAAEGDVVMLGVPSAEVYTHTSYFGWVSASDTVTVRFLNLHSGAHDPSSATFRATVIKY